MKTIEKIASTVNSRVILAVRAACAASGLDAAATARRLGVALDALERGRSADAAIAKATARLEVVHG